MEEVQYHIASLDDSLLLVCVIIPCISLPIAPHVFAKVFPDMVRCDSCQDLLQARACALDCACLHTAVPGLVL